MFKDIKDIQGSHINFAEVLMLQVNELQWSLLLWSGKETLLSAIMVIVIFLGYIFKGARLRFIS